MFCVSNDIKNVGKRQFDIIQLDNVKKWWCKHIVEIVIVYKLHEKILEEDDY